MKRLTLKLAVVAVLGVFAVPAYAQQKPTPVAVTNPTSSPVPVTVTNQTTPVPVSVTNPTANANVTVTNPAANPVKTIDAFPRTPVQICVDSTPNVNCPDSYIVPNDHVLVIETISAFASCAAGALPRAGLVAHTQEGAFRNYHLPIQSVGSNDPAVTRWSGLHSARILVMAATGVFTSAPCVSDSSTTGGSIELEISGYLVSASSPSFAP